MDCEATRAARSLALPLVMALALLFAAACAPTPVTPIVPPAPGAPAPIAAPVGIGVPALPVPASAGQASKAAASEELLFVVPPGTFAAEMAGEPSFSLPPTIPVFVGQAIAIRNDDHAMHYFFDAPIAPGQTIRKAFSRPGSYSYTPGLSCSLAKGAPVTVEVQAP